MRRNTEQGTNFFERVVVPKSENNNFPLVCWNSRQAIHGLALIHAGFWRGLKPALRVDFIGQPSPERAMPVDGSMAKGSHQVPIGSMRPFRKLQERLENLMQNVFRFSVTQT